MSDCDTSHCLVVAKVRERPSVYKREHRKLNMEIFNLKSLKEVECKRTVGVKKLKEVSIFGELMMCLSIGLVKALELT
jgi:uncharacterized metal-binding protein